MSGLTRQQYKVVTGADTSFRMRAHAKRRGVEKLSFCLLTASATNVVAPKMAIPMAIGMYGQVAEVVEPTGVAAASKGSTLIVVELTVVVTRLTVSSTKSNGVLMAEDTSELPSGGAANTGGVIRMARASSNATIQGIVGNVTSLAFCKWET